MKKIILIISMILSLLISCKDSSENKNISVQQNISTNHPINVGIYVYDYPFCTNRFSHSNI